MSAQTELFGYTEPQSTQSEPRPVIPPRSSSAAKTTHSFPIPVNKATNVTLLLHGSHSPEAKLRPLYYAPCTLEGEVVIEAKKSEELKSLTVSVGGVDQGAGFAMAGGGQGVMGEPGEHVAYFWQTKTANLLFDSTSDASDSPTSPTSPTSTAVEGPGKVAIEGTRAFAFSISIPDKYAPAAPKNKGHKRRMSLKDKVVSIFKPGHAHEKELSGASQPANEDEVASPVEPKLRPLPRTFLPHDQKSGKTKGGVVAQYSITVNLAFASKLKPGVSVRENIIILPLHDEESSMTPVTSTLPTLNSGTHA